MDTQTPPDASETVSRNVRRLRILRGWTQEEAGERLGALTGTTWSNASWSAAEARTRPRNWTANELVALTRLFGVGFDELFASDEAPAMCPTCGQKIDEPASKRRRHRLTPQLLARVAEVYEEGQLEGAGPLLAVTNHFNLPYSTAAKWVMRARKEGLIPPATEESAS